MIYLGSDHAGYKLKLEISSYLKEHLHKEFQDLGTYSEESCDYPIFAQNVCKKVLEGGAIGILICGTGIGMSMAANRFPGIRAALCHNKYTAQMVREHNDANVLCMGARITLPETAIEIVETFLTTPFSGEEKHKNRINMLETTALTEK